MKRLTEKNVFSGFTTAWRLAICRVGGWGRVSPIRLHVIAQLPTRSLTVSPDRGRGDQHRSDTSSAALRTSCREKKGRGENSQSPQQFMQGFTVGAPRLVQPAHTWPTRRSPPLVKATTEGVVRLPSALAMIVGLPPSIAATAELVVPKSMPTTCTVRVCALHPVPCCACYTAVQRRRDHRFSGWRVGVREKNRHAHTL